MTERKYTQYISIGSLFFALSSERPLTMLSGAAAFRISSESNIESNSKPFMESGIAFCSGVRVEVKEVEALPFMPAGDHLEDTMFRYYRDGTHYWMLAKPGTSGATSLAVYNSGFDEVVLYVNKKALPEELRTADKVLQLLPMKQLLAYYGAFLLHSSRICMAGRGILFTAPSQTGKTTQARLWQEYAGAEIVGNDRTLLWMRKEEVMTGGYPVDGSSPVYSSERIPLGAIVVLRQAPENRVQRLPASRALRFLMEQTALDAWNAEECAAAQKFWLELIAHSPVYLLQCRPDREAVACLREQLEKDEVIPGAIDTP